MALKLITDSTSDIDKELAKKLDIEVVPLKVIFGTEVFTEGVDISNEEFYKKLDIATAVPTTSQPSPDEFVDVFSKHINNKDEVLGIFISSELSGTFQSATIAKDILNSDKVHIIDSRNVTFALANLVFEAAKLRDKKVEVLEIVKKIETIKENLILLGIVDTLKYLKMGGRLSGAAAVIGGLLNIKPIVSVVEGKVVSVGKERGHKKAFGWVVQRIKDEPIDYNYGIVLAHTNAPHLIPEFSEYLTLNGVKLGDYTILNIGSVVGTHAGPGCVAMSYIKK